MSSEARRPAFKCSIISAKSLNHNGPHGLGRGNALNEHGMPHRMCIVNVQDYENSGGDNVLK